MWQSRREGKMIKDLSEFSLRDPETMECPYEFYGAMRRDQPVHQDARTGFYVVSRYADVLELLRNPKVFSSAMNRLTVHSTGAEEEIIRLYESKGWFPLSTLDSDPPEHTKYRALVSESFSARRIAGLVPHMTAIAEKIVDGLVDQGECEFVAQFARPFPLTIMADLLGVPHSDHKLFEKWSDAAIDVYGMMISREREVECTELAVDMQHYLAARIEERRQAPADDILTDLTRARYDGERELTMEEMLAFANVLLVAGNHTTSNALSNSLYLLVQHPALCERIAGDDTLIKAFIEESLRLESPVQGEIRIVTEDTVLAGTSIPKGAVVNFRVAAANRDEERFTDAPALDIDRKALGTHLAFGGGIHQCLGAQLARRELAIAFSVLLRRIKNIAAAPGRNDFMHTPNSFLRGLNRLYVTFDKR
jgi:cytochrome P450